MQTVTRDQISRTLSTIGIRSGDGLLVHSAIQFLGRPADGVGLFLDAILDVLGPEGTIVVPTFNFDFARGLPFDPKTTPSKNMGVFSELVRMHPVASRTMHPLQSVAVMGKYQDDLTNRDTLSAFDPDSAFDRMVELDFKLLLLGAEIQAASIVHYSEQRAAVPYRYWKEFSGQVKIGSEWKSCVYKMYVRNMEINPELNLNPIQEQLEAKGLWSTEKVNYGQISTCRLSGFVKIADHLLKNNPWSLVGNASSSHKRYLEIIEKSKIPLEQNP